MICNFTLQHYEDICKLINKSNYNVIFFNQNLGNNKKILILRHDVDLSLEQSLKMAMIEKKYEIKSTFFIWLSSPFYNVFEKEYSDIIFKIIKLGHKIGLHFDEYSYKISNETDLNHFIEKEVGILNNYFNLNIDVISMHRPSKWILDNDIRLNKYINSYSKKYLKEFKYISDSRMQWREGCVCKKITSEIYPKLHLLLHPIWWVEKEKNFDSKLTQFIIKKDYKIKSDLEKNISTYKIKR